MRGLLRSDEKLKDPDMEHLKHRVCPWPISFPQVSTEVHLDSLQAERLIDAPRSGPTPQTL